MVFLIMLTTPFMLNIMGHTRIEDTNTIDVEFTIVDAHYVQPAIYNIGGPRNKR